MTAQIPMSDDAYCRAIGQDRVLRWSTADDSEAVARLYSEVFRDDSADPPNEHMKVWTRDMMSGRHPLIGPTDFAFVEDTGHKRVIAATCLLSQTWEYEGIPFPVGRPEVVATAVEHRSRGYIRAIFELIHARSAACNHVAQGITGIPYYYRQFGYEYALDLDGSRDVYFADIPALKDGELEPYVLREATSADVPLLQRLYDRARAGSPVSARVDAPYWRWVLEGMNPAAVERWRVLLIAPTSSLRDEEAAPVGYLLAAPLRWGKGVHVLSLAVEQGIALVVVLPPVLRSLQRLAVTMKAGPKAPPAGLVTFRLGRTNPVYDTLGDMAPAYRPPYAWYVRVPDLPRFIRHIAPALDARLAASVMSGYSGEMTLDFYRAGLRLTFENGRLITAENWRVQQGTSANAGFPPLVFLQLLFGYRGLDELRHAFPDVWTKDEPRPLLQALFPSRPSWVLPLE